MKKYEELILKATKMNAEQMFTAVAAQISVISFCSQLFSGNGFNYGMASIIISFPAAFLIHSASKSSRILFSIFSALCTLLVHIFFIKHLFQFR